MLWHLIMHALTFVSFLGAYLIYVYVTAPSYVPYIHIMRSVRQYEHIQHRSVGMSVVFLLLLL